MKRNTITGFLHGTQTFVIDSSLTFNQLLNLVASETDLFMKQPPERQNDTSYRYKGMMVEDYFCIEKTKTPFYQYDLLIDGQLKESKAGTALHLTFYMKRYSWVFFWASILVLQLPVLLMMIFLDDLTPYLGSMIEDMGSLILWITILTIANWYEVWRQGKKEAGFLRKQIEKLENAPMLESPTDTGDFFVSQNAPQTEGLGKR